jgi:hypothetical protein
MTWKIDNRWSPGASGADVPDDAPAAYAARWIDRGDDRFADILLDRQGFAYDDEVTRDQLIYWLLRVDARIRVPYSDLITRDETYHAVEDDEFHVAQRRSGGYIYVDAWLTPPATP